MDYRVFLRFVIIVTVTCSGFTPIPQATGQNKQSRAAAAAKKRRNQVSPKRKPAPKSKLPTPDEEDRRRVSIAGVDPYARKSARESAAKIDQLIESNLIRHQLTPNPKSQDAQFVRRAYLDIVGTIPTGRKAFAFIDSKAPDNRIELIDHLLDQPGYASHLFNYFADMLRIVDKSAANTYIRPFGNWLRESFRSNRSYQRIVYEMLTAEGKPWENPATGYKLRDRGMPLGNLNNTVRVFLGTRIGCAQCHDHPFDRWTQKEFYELAAFEGGIRTTVPRKQFKMKVEEAEQLVSARREKQWVKRLERYNREQVYERTKVKLRFPKDYAYDDVKPRSVVQPSVIFGHMPALKRGDSRREALADWLTSKDNPRFTMSIANRLWKRAFGIGLFEPEDDIRDDTEASNPELLDFLISELKRLDFDLKEFQRIIYYTNAYQRQATYETVDLDKPYHFQGPLLRRMTAEQVWDSLLTLTLEDPDHLLRPTDETFIEALDADSETAASELAEKARELSELQAAQRRKNRTHMYKGVILRRASELPQPLPDDHFLRQFGQSDRQIISSGNTDGTVPQLLTLFNGPVTHMMLEEGSVIYNAVFSTGKSEAKGIGDQVKIIFLSVLGRAPTTREMTRAGKEIRANKSAGCGDVIWALLNTREFLFVQ